MTSEQDDSCGVIIKNQIVTPTESNTFYTQLTTIVIPTSIS